MSDSSILPAVTDHHLLTPVQQALGTDHAQLGGWAIQPLAGGRGLKGGVYRIAGDARVGRGLMPWSLILKIVSDPQSEDNEQGVNYWKRGFLAYHSQLLAAIPGGVAAPRCFSTITYPGEATWLWLEDIQSASGSSWTVAHYGRSAALRSVQRRLPGGSARAHPPLAKPPVAPEVADPLRVICRAAPRGVDAADRPAILSGVDGRAPARAVETSRCAA